MELYHLYYFKSHYFSLYWRINSWLYKHQSINYYCNCIICNKLIPLLLLKFEHEKNTYKLSLKQTIKEVPTSDIYLLGSYELIFEYYNYNLLYEFTQNLFRSIVVFLLFISNFNIKNMVYITLLFIFIGVFLQKRNTEVDKQ